MAAYAGRAGASDGWVLASPLSEFQSTRTKSDSLIPRTHHHPNHRSARSGSSARGSTAWRGCTGWRRRCGSRRRRRCSPRRRRASPGSLPRAWASRRCSARTRRSSSRTCSTVRCGVVCRLWRGGVVAVLGVCLVRNRMLLNQALVDLLTHLRTHMAQTRWRSPTWCRCRSTPRWRPCSACEKAVAGFILVLVSAECGPSSTECVRS